MAGPVTDPRAGVLRKRYRERFPATPEIPVPVEAIAGDLLGLAVGERDYLEVSGMLLPGEREIWLNSSESPARRRFTLAHELGHWVCQVQEGRRKPVFCRSDDVGVEEGRALEREANVFAAELLMPEDTVREVWSGEIAASAARLGVSAQAMHWRAYTFGLVGEPPR